MTLPAALNASDRVCVNMVIVTKIYILYFGWTFFFEK